MIVGAKYRGRSGSVYEVAHEYDTERHLFELRCVEMAKGLEDTIRANWETDKAANGCEKPWDEYRAEESTIHVELRWFEENSRVS